VDIALSNLKVAWGSVMSLDFEYLNSEVNPHFVGTLSSSEVVVTAVFHVDMEGSGGEFHVALPYSLLEPLRETLMAPVQARGLERDAEFERALVEHIQGAYVEVAFA
jgi:flagellar motor switch protein FliM